MIYHDNGGVDNSTKTVTGAALAQHVRHLSAASRACLAADILDGRVIIQGQTVKTVAAVTCVSVAYVAAAARLTPEQRQEVRAHRRPLIQPAWPRPSSVPATVTWAEIDDAALVDAIKTIGIDRMLDVAIAVENSTTTA